MAGSPTRANVYIDVNNGAFLPNSYSSFTYSVGEVPPLLPQDPAARVAIVYSETSADRYFDKTAYGQLFMAAQSQAMQAGIPFDVIAESDLTDIAKLVKYDALVFPGFANVQTADLAQITATLTSAVQDYKIGLIAMGDFMSNDETGAAIAGNSYARMQSLLGVTLDGFGATTGVTIRAETNTHPVSDLYAPNELVGTYTGNTAYVTYRDVSGSGQTLFTQTVGTAGTGVQDVSAVIVTTTGGRNVHFATDAAFGNNNILSEAINWSARGDAPDVGLQMTRSASMFFSRNDMDVSMQFDEVNATPGVYDAMLPIIEAWYADYGFVGSYYINIGNDGPGGEDRTDWAKSRPYYEAILALDSEIGSHSYTHPFDTNLLTPAQIRFEFEAVEGIHRGSTRHPAFRRRRSGSTGRREYVARDPAILRLHDWRVFQYRRGLSRVPSGFSILTSRTRSISRRTCPSTSRSSTSKI